MKFIKIQQFIILSLFIPALLSLKVPDAPAGRISDYAGMLSVSAKEEITAVLEEFENKTSVQIAVVTFPSLEGESLEDFSIRLAEKWKIGQKGKDNGVILLIFLAERKIRIEVGYGLESVLPDVVASSIIRNIMAPRFREGDFDGGIKEAVGAIMKIVSGEKVPEVENKNKFHISKDDLFKLKMLLIVIAGFFFLFFLVDIFRYRGYATSLKDYSHRYSFIEWFIVFSITLAILKAFFYSRGRSYSGGRKGFDGFSGGGFGGGGFSGGGGGFGGGGASGGW